MMNIISNIKTIAELVTAFSAAIIVLGKAFKMIPKPIQNFFSKMIPTFFCGTTTSEGEKVRFFKALKQNKIDEEISRSINKVLFQGIDMETELVLDQEELSKILLETKLFRKVTMRKQ